jgi:hypothetical protein
MGEMEEVSRNTLLETPDDITGLQDHSVEDVYQYKKQNKACVIVAPDGDTIVPGPVLRAVQKSGKHVEKVVDMETSDTHNDGMIAVYLSNSDDLRDHTLSIDDILDHSRVVDATIHDDGVIYLDWSSTYRILGPTFWLLWQEVCGWRVAWINESDSEDASSMLVLLHESIGDE